MKQKIDLQTWDRKDHFDFYSRFKEPYHGVNVSLDISTLKERCKAENSSVFMHYLHRAIIAVNEVEAFRYRILNNEV